MSEPSVDEIVAHFERHHAQVEDLASVTPAAHVRALIASWRERGEALKEIADTPIWSEFTTNGLIEHYMAIRATASAALGPSPKATEPT